MIGNYFTGKCLISSDSENNQVVKSYVFIGHVFSQEGDTSAGKNG